MEFLNVSIRARIEDFDNYYVLHFQDFRTPFFEKQKYRLRRLLAESVAVDGYEIDGDELEIITDEQLEQVKKETIISEVTYSQYTERKMLASMGCGNSRARYGQDNGSGYDGGNKKQRIQESVNRLTSPPRRYQIAEAKIRDKNSHNEELVFSIQMNKNEYELYRKEREQFKRTQA